MVTGTSGSPGAAAPAHQRRFLLTLSIMLATSMQALDSTIANVALPHMRGTLGASQEQISWVLTSYIIASAICMPLTGFISSRVGRKKLFLWAVIGFTVTSMLCGAAQSLEQIVIFRLLQGACGACLVPLSQAALLDAYPRELHGKAMAMWGVGVMIGPILGPTLGGWLTEYYSWRWVFYINLPFGVLAWFGIVASLDESAINKSRRFDVFGFACLSIALGTLQLMLDRGESLDWFASTEIQIEALVIGTAFYLFIAHVFTSDQPYVEPGIFRDRNFSFGLIVIAVTGMILMATMALLPPFMQSLMGYPIFDVGLLLAPRGLGTMAAMVLVGKLSGKVDPRHEVIAGLLLASFSLWQMTQFTPDMPTWHFVVSGIIQGVGLGLIFSPMSVITFSSLAPRYRNEATALYALVRNIGGSIGISVMVTYLARQTQINHAIYADYLQLSSLPLREAIELGAADISTVQGLSALNAQVGQQAALMAFLQDFRLMMWATLAAIPLVALFRKP